jgi:hypothetical protein
LATGHPAWPIDPAWDFAPLVISLVLLALLPIARVPLRLPVVVVVFVAGLLIDGVTDALGIPFIDIVAALLAVSLLLSLRTSHAD